jgi:hypothetical protein
MKNITRQVQSSPGFTQFPLQRQFGPPSKPGKPPAPTPPVTQTASEVVQASMQQKKDAVNRQGYASTLLAGETGAGMTDQSATKKTLLGS